MPSPAPALTVSSASFQPRPRLEVVPSPDGQLIVMGSMLFDADERLTRMAGALADAVDAKGEYHPSHCRAVARLAQALGATLGIRGPTLFRLGIAGLLHDVGKLHVPDAILLKPGRLTVTEYDTIKHHPVAGHQMLLGLGLHDEARWVLHHHERGDGSGYPSGLQGDAIPIGSRILLVADAYDCLTATRVYSRAASHPDAMRELHAHAGTQFDPAVIDALHRITAPALPH